MSIDTNGGASASDDLFADEPADTGTSNATHAAPIPDKYKGKSVDDIIAMHRNAEKKISEQGADLAAQRRLSDKILELGNRSQPDTKHTERQPVTVEALLNDPDKALQSAVDSKNRATEERISRLESSITQKDFTAKHSSYQEDMEDPEFKSWIAKNEARQVLANESANGNFRAATSLWDMWSERKELAEGLKTSPKATVKPRTPSTVKATPQENHQSRVFSRAKLMELRAKVHDGDPAATERWKDPEFQRAMIEAYDQGRVK